MSVIVGYKTEHLPNQKKDRTLNTREQQNSSAFLVSLALERPGNVSGRRNEDIKIYRKLMMQLTCPLKQLAQYATSDSSSPRLPPNLPFTHSSLSKPEECLEGQDAYRM